MHSNGVVGLPFAFHRLYTGAYAVETEKVEIGVAQIILSLRGRTRKPLKNNSSNRN